MINRLKSLAANRLKYVTAWLILFVVLICGGLVTNTVLGSGKVQETSSVEATPSEGIPSPELSLEEEAQILRLNDAAASTNEEPPADKKPEIVKYLVKSGDTLESVASQFGIKVSSISESNGIAKNSVLKEGQELKFPSVDGIVYKIKKGETLSDLVSTYNVDSAKIVEVNNLTSPDRLKVGQEIMLPGVDKVKVEVAKTEPKKTSVAAAKPSTPTVKVASRSSAPVEKTPSITGGWPAAGVLYSKYGYRGKEFHKGIDVSAPAGTDIFAYADGKVVSSGWDGSGYGNLIIIDHGNGIQTYYAHNSKNLVSVGDLITKGQHIAEMGRTGQATGNHVHFEVRVNGTPKNPLNYLK